MRRFSSFHYFPTKNIQKFNSYLVPQPSSWITCCLKTFQEASRTFSRTSLLQKKVWEGVDMGWHGLTWVDRLICSSVWLFGLLFWAKRFTFSYSGSCFGLRWTHECFCFCIYCGFVWRFIVTCPSPAPRCAWHSEAKRILEHLMAKPRATQLHQSPSKVAKCCKACFAQHFAVFRMDCECMWEFGKYCSCAAV